MTADAVRPWCGLKDEESFTWHRSRFRRETRRATTADAESEDRRGWLSYGLAALGISALGLAIAGSVSLTTSAQPLPVKEPTASGAATRRRPVRPPVRHRDQAQPRPRPRRSGAFAPRGGLTGAGATGSAALRTAVLKEQAAQRAEELAKGADDITRAASTASSDARQNRLTAADRASREAAARLNEARIRRAVAARIAAASEREAQETTELAAQPSPTVSSIPTGWGRRWRLSRCRAR